MDNQEEPSQYVDMECIISNSSQTIAACATS